MWSANNRMRGRFSTQLLELCCNKQIPPLPSMNTVLNVPSRSLINYTASEPIKLFADLWEAAQRGVMVLGQDRSRLQQLVPPSQQMMPARSMKDSLTLARIPLGSCAGVGLKYEAIIGGERLGQLLQDMDNFAAVVLYNRGP